MRFFHHASHNWRKLFTQPIKWYQRHLSPDHSHWAKIKYPAGYCKYTPTCSDYTVQAIETRGVVVGVLKGIWRIVRCNPWSKGGKDLP